MAILQNKVLSFVDRYIWRLKQNRDIEKRVNEIIVQPWYEKYGIEKPADIETYGKVYTANEWVYICVNTIAEASQEVELIVEEKKKIDGEVVYEKVTDAEHPIYMLFDRVNDNTTEAEFKELTLSALSLQGNAYWWKVFDTMGIPRQLYFLRPDWMKVIPSKEGLVKGYEFNNGFNKEYFEAEEILHFKTYNPRSYFYGLSPISAARTTITADIYAKIFQKNFFANSSRPGGILTTEQHMSLPDIKSLEKRWELAHKGPKEAFKTAILTGGLDYKSVAITPKDSDFIEQLKDFRETILGIFRIPPAMVNIYEYANYANAEAQRKIFWTDVMTKKLGRVSSYVNEYLIYPVWGDQYRVRYDYSGIEVLQESLDQKLERISKGIELGMLSPNQGSEMMGWPLGDKSGDKRYMRFNLLAVGENPKGQEGKSVKKKSLEIEAATKLAQTREQGINKVRADFYSALSEMFIEQGDKLADFVKGENSIKTIGQDDLIGNLDPERIWEKGNFGQMTEDTSDYFIGLCMLQGIATARDLSGIDIILDLDSPKIAPVKEAMLKKLRSLTDKTSKDKLRDILMSGFNEHKTVDEVTREIKREWGKYSTYRAERISRTETANAYGEGSYRYYKETGVKEKRWLTMGDDRVADMCLGNESDGWIPIDDEFASGMPHEPNHVNCRCSVIYR
jgi:HK97 family phage portal protein